MREKYCPAGGPELGACTSVSTVLSESWANGLRLVWLCFDFRYKSI